MRKISALFSAFLVSCIAFSTVSCKYEKPKITDAEAEKSADTESAAIVQVSPKEQLAVSIVQKLNLPTADLIQQNTKEFVADFEQVYKNDKDYLLVLVDKTHHLSKDYIPEDLIPLSNNDYYSVSRNDLSLRVPVADALKVMAAGALKDNIWLMVSSTFRSYEYQEKLFARWVAIDGLEEAERESARAGTSQHQLGTAIDFGSIDDSFAETKAGKWLDQNAADYGFSLSFPQGYEPVTGYRWECWHYRYIGIDACKLQKKWFGNIQQYMMEFIDAWERAGGNTL